MCKRMNVCPKWTIDPDRAIELEPRCGGKLNLRPSSRRVDPTKLRCWIERIPAKEYRLPNSSAKPADCPAPVKFAGQLPFGSNRHPQIGCRCPAIDVPIKAPILSRIVAAHAKSQRPPVQVLAPSCPDCIRGLPGALPSLWLAMGAV